MGENDLGNSRNTPWWGYRHINGNIIVKRFLDPEDLKEAKLSSFVNEVFPPFLALNRDEALQILMGAEDN